MCFLSTIASASSASALSKVLLLLVYCSVVDPVAPAWSNDLKSGTDFLCVTSNATTTTYWYPPISFALSCFSLDYVHEHFPPLGPNWQPGGRGRGGWEVEN